MRLTFVGLPSLPHHARSALMSSRVHCLMRRPLAARAAARFSTSAAMASGAPPASRARGLHLNFGPAAGLLDRHDPLGRRRPRLGALVRHRQEARQRALDAFPAGAGVALRAKAAAGDLLDRLDVGDLRKPEFLGRLRGHLGRVAVDRLAPAQDQVHRLLGPDLADGAREDVTGGQGVAGGGPAVRQQDGVVGPALQGCRAARRRPAAAPW